MTSAFGKDQGAVLSRLDLRSRDVFRVLVNHFIETNSAAGSETVVSKLGHKVSAATVRHVMAHLQAEGLLCSRHRSSGRLPTDFGLRLFVESLMEVGPLDVVLKRTIESKMQTADAQAVEAKTAHVSALLERASDVVSAVAHCTGLVMSPRRDMVVKHIEFLPLQGRQVLVILVAEDGSVENRLMVVPAGFTQASLIEAANYLNTRLSGRTLSEAVKAIKKEIDEHRSQLTSLSERVVSMGLAVWSGDGSGRLIVRGQARLMDDIDVLEDIDRIRTLLGELESGRNIMTLLEHASKSEGLKIFIGAEHPLFNHAGCSLIIAPVKGQRDSILGAIGIVGPARMDYARIISIVDYTAQLVSQLTEQDDV